MAVKLLDIRLRESIGSGGVRLRLLNTRPDRARVCLEYDEEAVIHLDRFCIPTRIYAVEEAAGVFFRCQD